MEGGSEIIRSTDPTIPRSACTGLIKPICPRRQSGVLCRESRISNRFAHGIRSIDQSGTNVKRFHDVVLMVFGIKGWRATYGVGLRRRGPIRLDVELRSDAFRLEPGVQFKERSRDSGRLLAPKVAGPEARAARERPPLRGLENV